MSCEHKPIVEGGANPCACCPPILTKASMTKMIAVGFGTAELTRDGVVVIDGERIASEAVSWDEVPTFADAERIAAADPEHDWRVVLHGPLHGETYQRQGHESWMCIERNKGFA